MKSPPAARISSRPVTVLTAASHAEADVTGNTADLLSKFGGFPEVFKVGEKQVEEYVKQPESVLYLHDLNSPRYIPVGRDS
jgi:hypothetical protein